MDNGRSLREDVKALTNHSGSRNYVDIPVFLKGGDGEGDGIGRRQCIKEPHLHSLRRPLAEAVAFDEVGLGDDGQRDGFGNEGEGHCGV